MKKASILIVDDDRTILQTLKAILESKGYITDTAETGNEAIEKSKSKFYNLALLDIRLPDMEGTKLLTEMKDTHPKMMKIMITGHASLENAMESLNHGADAYLMKPVKPDELLKTIEEKLKAQEITEKMTQQTVTHWIETRAKRLKL